MIFGHVTVKCDCCKIAASYDVPQRGVGAPAYPVLSKVSRGQFLEVEILTKELWEKLYPDREFFPKSITQLCKDCCHKNATDIEPV